MLQSSRPTARSVELRIGDHGLVFQRVKFRAG